MRKIQIDGQCHIEVARSCVVAERKTKREQTETQGELYRNVHSTVRKRPTCTGMKASLVIYTNRFCTGNFPNS